MHSRLRLRALQTHDWRFLHTIQGPDLSMHRTEEGTRAFLRRLLDQQQAIPRRFYRWIIILHPSTIPVGWCDLYHDPIQPDTVELGYRIDERWWGQGYATEAAGLLMTMTFAHTIIQHVWAQTGHDHTSSQRVLSKLGMTEIALAEQRDRMRRFILTRSAWNTRHPDVPLPSVCQEIL